MDSNNISSNLGDGGHGEYNPPVAQSGQSSITAFLAKLWALVNDSTCDDLISWDPTGGSFHVYDQSRFAREILPRYFKHNNFASFIRQLNMYGFRKISNIEHGSLQNERDDIEFAHPHFIRGQESLLELIKRRAPDSQQKSNLQGGPNASTAIASANFLDSKAARSFEFSHLLEDVRGLKSKQTSLCDKLSYMQNENQALWGEIGSLRQKHSRQQQIVTKLMEFLLHFISNNSDHHHDQSVEQQAPNEALHATTSHPQGAQTLHHTNNSPLVLSEQGQLASSLKRKLNALVHLDDANKRANLQQQQQQQQGSRPMNFGRQQSVTINELTDKESSGWHHASNATPVVDLVPSPPPSNSGADDNYHQQQQQPGNDYRWSPTTNDLLQSGGPDQKHPSQQAPTFQPVGNGSNATNTFAPDFLLRTDNSNGVNTNTRPVDGANATGGLAPQANPTKPAPVIAQLKGEPLDFPQVYQPNASQQVNDLKTSPTLYSQNQQQEKIGQPVEQLSFSLDDITGDVDNIQSTLDTIRDLMFDNLPDGTSIEDLFGPNNGSLSPLLHSTLTNDETPNLLLESIKDQKLLSNDNQSDDTNNVVNSQSVPNVNDQLLEQLITETAKVGEQKTTINQLAHEKAALEDKVHLLEQQKTRRN